MLRYFPKRILLTGHSGFKGSWFSCILACFGAKVSGLSLDATEIKALNSFLTSQLDNEIFADIREIDACRRAISETDPEVVFHLAAQPLVRRSYREPLETWTTNVIGTANILEACRHSENIKAIVVITTDKCYENKEWVHPYREGDRLGGHDPYSASKACAELVVASYRDSFFRAKGVQVATARAGNVIGGGDFADDRLIPDAVRAFINDKPLILRHPEATRPWQHVLEPLSGYVALAEKLLSRPHDGLDAAWNFGPNTDGNATVGEVAERFGRFWGGGRIETQSASSGPHEAGLLQLDNSRAKTHLGWHPRWSLEETLSRTADWYLAWHEGRDVAGLMQGQIADYFRIGA